MGTHDHVGASRYRGSAPATQWNPGRFAGFQPDVEWRFNDSLYDEAYGPVDSQLPYVADLVATIQRRRPATYMLLTEDGLESRFYYRADHQRHCPNVPSTWAWAKGSKYAFKHGDAGREPQSGKTVIDVPRSTWRVVCVPCGRQSEPRTPEAHLRAGWRIGCIDWELGPTEWACPECLS